MGTMDVAAAMCGEEALEMAFEVEVAAEVAGKVAFEMAFEAPVEVASIRAVTVDPALFPPHLHGWPVRAAAAVCRVRGGGVLPGHPTASSAAATPGHPIHSGPHPPRLLPRPPAWARLRPRRRRPPWRKRPVRPRRSRRPARRLARGDISRIAVPRVVASAGNNNPHGRRARPRGGGAGERRGDATPRSTWWRRPK